MSHPLGACVNNLKGNIKDLSPFEGFPPKERIPGATVVKGGVSWRVLDSASDVIDQIIALTPMGTSIGTNYRCVPRYFYDLTMAPRTVTVVLQWSTDTIRFEAPDPSVDSQEQASSVNIELVQNLNKAFEAWKNELPKADLQAEWALQADEVKKCISSLVEEAKKNPDSPLYIGILKLQESSAAKQTYVKNLIETAGADPLKLEILNKTTLPEMSENVRNILGSFQQNPTGFRMTAAALAALSESDSSRGAGNFVSEYGHTFIDSYTEAGKLSAIWSLEANKDTADEDWMKVRVLINQYFAAARSVNDVCDFFASGVHSYLSNKVTAGADADLKFDVKTTVFGYRSMTSSPPRVLQDLDPRHAKYYLTPEALACNRVQTSYHVRPFQGLPTNLPYNGAAANSFKALTNPRPDRTFLLSLQNIQRKLFILNAFAKASTDVDAARAKLLEWWAKFNEFQDSTTMDANGNVDAEKAVIIETFEKGLQNRLLEAESGTVAATSNELDPRGTGTPSTESTKSSSFLPISPVSSNVS